MAFPENASRLRPVVAPPRRFGLYSLFSVCLSWVILLLSGFLLFLLFYVLYRTPMSSGTFLTWLMWLSASDLLALLGAAGAILFGHLGILQESYQREVAIVGLVLGYLSFAFFVLVGVGWLLLLVFLSHSHATHFVM